MSEQKNKGDFKAKNMAEASFGRNEECLQWKFPSQQLKWF